MKNTFKIVLACLSFCIQSQAQDIRGKVRDKVQAKEELQSIISEIEPSEHIFGIKYGTTENEFIAKFGNPDGYVRINADTTAMIYGKRMAFIFQSEKLDGVRIKYSILDYQLSEEMLTSSLFEKIKWELTNGIKKNTSLPKVKEILGDSLINENRRWKYETDVATVTLSFARFPGEGESEFARKVSDITIRKK